MVRNSLRSQGTGTATQVRTDARSAAEINQCPVMFARAPKNVPGFDVSVRVPHVMHDLHGAHHMHERLEDGDEVGDVGARKLVEALALLDDDAWREDEAPEPLGAIRVAHHCEGGGHELLEDGALVELGLASERLHSSGAMP